MKCKFQGTFDHDKGQQFRISTGICEVSPVDSLLFLLASQMSRGKNRLPTVLRLFLTGFLSPLGNVRSQRAPDAVKRLAVTGWY